MINRREALKKFASFAGIAALGSSAKTFAAPENIKDSIEIRPGSPGRKRVLRAAHITDIHIFDKYHAPEWFAKCLHQIQSEKDPPQIVLNTGDCVMDSLKADETHARALWKIWNDVLKNELSLPIRHGLGNHDCWGWGLPADAPGRKDPDFGRKLGMEGLGLAKPYYSFDQAGWHFIMLASLQPGTKKTGGTYLACLDDEQSDWLEKDLKAVPSGTPVMIMSHVPIMSACAVWACHGRDAQTNRIVRNTVMHTDGNKLIHLFREHPNVKMAISGHLHMIDRVDLEGISFLCNGSVCGQWWRGYRVPLTGVDKGIPPGYALLDLYDDGTFDCEYKGFGWDDSYLPKKKKSA